MTDNALSEIPTPRVERKSLAPAICALR